MSATPAVPEILTAQLEYVLRLAFADGAECGGLTHRTALAVERMSALMAVELGRATQQAVLVDADSLRVECGASPEEWADFKRWRHAQRDARATLSAGKGVGE